MGISYNTSIVSDGLVFALDAANSRSYAGSGNTAYSLIANIQSTLVGGVGFSSLRTQSFYFDGVNGQIVSNNYYQYIVSTNNDHSMFAWINSSINSAVILNWGEYSDSLNATGISISNGFLSWEQNGNSTDAANTVSTFLVPSGMWSFVGFVRNSSNVTIYLNGSSATYTPTYAPSGASIAPSNNPFTIGRGSTNGTARSFYQGNISQVQIYNRALSFQEMRQNYNATKKRYGL